MCAPVENKQPPPILHPVNAFGEDLQVASTDVSNIR
jgi:hypothetical protein